jgi:hypothetical protein
MFKTMLNAALTAIPKQTNRTLVENDTHPPRNAAMGIMSVRQASWRVPAGASPAQVRHSSRLVVSVAWWKVTTTKRTQRLCGVGY